MSYDDEFPAGLFIDAISCQLSEWVMIIINDFPIGLFIDATGCQVSVAAELTCCMYLHW